MQRYLKNLELWFQKWRLKTSGSKCSYNIYQKNNACKNDLNLVFFNEKIMRDKNPKYLGIILDSNMSLKTYVEYIRNKCIKKMNILKILCNKKWKIQTHIKLIIYFSLIRSNIDYASVLNNHVSDYCKKRLQGIQYNSLRLILNKPLAYSSTEMHKNLKLNTIQERSKYLHEKYKKESKENNPIIKKFIQ
jgi:hypothetical protein